MGALKGLVVVGLALAIPPVLAGETRVGGSGGLAWSGHLPHGEKGTGGRIVAVPAGDSVSRWHAEIAEASARFVVPAAWIEHVMRAESGGKTVWKGLPITSRAGAMGLMQIMPRTWAAMREALGLGGNPHDPRDNILAGTAYLRAMYDRFGYPGLFAAYNAGPGHYQAHLASGKPLPAETLDYLVKVAGTRAAGTLAPASEMAGSPGAAERRSARPLLVRSARPKLFVAVRGGETMPGDRLSSFVSPSSVRDRLFVVREPR